MSSQIVKKSIILAPLEGITDSYFREVWQQCFPDWDLLFSSFLRVPGTGYYPTKQILRHFGKKIFQNPKEKDKNILQILTSESSNTEATIKTIEQIGLKWIDINFGCPSKMVTSHKGGSYLLSDLNALKKIVSIARKSFPHTLSAKIRIGFKDSDNFDEIIRILEGEGIDLITIHPRTKVQMYRGLSDWNFIKRAVSLTKVPIIGNGDIQSSEDITKMLQQTGCHSIMVGRGALASPWMAKEYKDNSYRETQSSATIRALMIQLKERFCEQGLSEDSVLKRLKGLTHYLLTNLENSAEIKPKFLRSQTLETAMHTITKQFHNR